MSLRFAAGLLVSVLAAPASAMEFNDKPTTEQAAFFEKKIRPALVEHCYKCHSADADKLKGGLALDTREGVREGGDGGAVVLPGSPDKSPLIKAVRYLDATTKMPPKGKLPDAVVADFERWVAMGAPDPRTEAGGRKAVEKPAPIDIEKGRSHWSFQPPKAKSAPAVKDAAWATSEVDRFVLAALETKGLKPVGDADARTLIRRAYLDLTGLPPTADEVESFAADRAPDAFEKVVDRLLASPRFGERWGRHWLDVARFAETTGKTTNFNYPHAWRYRDYVIAAFNADKPFDQFVKEQLAGDLLPGGDPTTKAERTVATGFLAVGPKALNARNGLQCLMDLLDEQSDLTTQAFLGLTVACARCHDHKFDPIPTRDYYALAGVFKSTETCYGTVRFVQSQRPSALVTLPQGSAQASITTKLTDAERAAAEKNIAELQVKLREGDIIARLLTSAQLALARSKLDLYEKDGTPKLLAMGAREGFRPANSPVYARGEVDKPGEVVPRGVVRVVGTNQPVIRSGSGRKELAEWIASKDNPLTARVMVNRVWLHVFGRGLVATPDNFGVGGAPPTHPELLDRLAVSFADGGWSVKTLVRTLVLSHAYRLSSKHDAANVEADPDNTLLWRATPRRVEAEVLRDSILAVSGQLDAKPPVGSPVAAAGEGPSNRPRLGPAGGVRPDAETPFRSIYLPVVRDNLPESLALFDGADPSLIVADRPTTNVPSQGLFLLNNPFVLKASDAVADTLLKETTTDSERVRAAYLKFYGRPPVEKELIVADAFLAEYRKVAAKGGPPAAGPPRGPFGGRGPGGFGRPFGGGQTPVRGEREVWSAFAQALFASAEFQYRR